MSQDLAQIEPGELALNAGNPIAPMLQAITTAGVTAENVTALEKLLDVYERMENKRAEREFAAAFAALQESIPNVVARKPVPTKDGSIKFVFAPYEDIMDVVKPLLAKHGFSVSHSCVIAEGRATATCIITHAGGHERRNSFSARIGSGPPGCNEAQADESARSLARRVALCDALNIVIEKESDARNEGDTISQECADDLQRRVRALGGDEAKFLKLANAATFADVRSVKYGVLIAAIEERERAQPAPDFSDPAKWRAAMLEGFAERGARQPAAAFDAALAKSGADKHTDVPEPRRVAAWRALRAGKLDVFLAAEVVDRGAGLGGESRPPR